jgi:hypothetical protein
VPFLDPPPEPSLQGGWGQRVAELLDPTRPFPPWFHSYVDERVSV